LGAADVELTASLLASGSILTGSTFTQSLELIQPTTYDPFTDFGGAGDDRSRYTIFILYPSESTVANKPENFVLLYGSTDVSTGTYVAAMFEPAGPTTTIRPVKSSAPIDLPISHSYTTYYGTIADTYTTWSYIHIIDDGGIPLDAVKTTIRLTDPSI
jgi:hypothetical protein